MRLSLAQQTAIEAINADIARLRNKLRAVMQEAGLDPDARYRIEPDGSVELVDAHRLEPAGVAGEDRAEDNTHRLPRRRNGGTPAAVEAAAD